jgi:hypothetical protein
VYSSSNYQSPASTSQEWKTIQTTATLVSTVKEIWVAADWADQGSGDIRAKLALVLSRNGVEQASHDIFGLYQRPPDTVTSARIDRTADIVNLAVKGDVYILKEFGSGFEGYTLTISTITVGIQPDEHMPVERVASVFKQSELCSSQYPTSGDLSTEDTAEDCAATVATYHQCTPGLPYFAYSVSTKGCKCCSVKNASANLVQGAYSLYKTSTVDLNNWTRVRHTPDNGGWYKSTDSLAGSQVYGDPADDTQQWSV